MCSKVKTALLVHHVNDALTIAMSCNNLSMLALLCVQQAINALVRLSRIQHHIVCATGG